MRVALKTENRMNPRRGRIRRGGEEGQMVPLLAIFAVVLLGCTAIATDLSVSTHYHRNLQNITDGAALAGAKQLPINVTSLKQVTATKTALEVIHNSFPWATAPGWSAALSVAGCNAAALRCSVTVCAGLTSPPCAGTNVSAGNNPPFSLTVNTPPQTATVATFNNSDLSVDPHFYQRVEVVMHQQSGGFFSGIFGVSSEVAGAQSVAYHFAADQPFPFALFSNTVIGDGNSPEIIQGNVYADRYLAPQSNGQAAICAGPDPNGNPGYIVLGAPQGGDSGYANDGQYNDNNVPPGGDPIQDNFNPCSSIGAGQVGMSANPVNTTGCANAFGGALSGSTMTFNSLSHACEATPALQDPQVAAEPNIPSYSTTQCMSNPKSGVPIDPTEGAFKCNGKNAPSLLISGSITMNTGIYEILPSGNAPCDVVIDGTFTQLTGVTFYLEQGAGICANPASNVYVHQTPYCGTCSNPNGATPGDGVYDILSDNSGLNPSITMNTAGGGSSSGVWQMYGVIWLPTGTINIGNRTRSRTLARSSSTRGTTPAAIT